MNAYIHQINEDYHPTICGPNGTGLPIITAERIIFNGNTRTHRWYARNPNAALSRAEQDDAHEDFDLFRLAPTPLTTGYRYDTTETNGKPYGATIRVTFLLLRHYFPHSTLIVAAPATPEEWRHAFNYARCVEPDITLPKECRLTARLADDRPARATA